MRSSKHSCLRIVLLAILLLPMATQVKGQMTLDTLTKSFSDYRTRAVTEKIYIHTDRSFYLTGETMWFSVYQVDGSLHKPIDLSKVVYVEVVSPTNEAVVQLKVEMKNGFGSGTLFLSASLNSATYALRAYTSLMKNFSPELYFQKTFTLVNPFVRLPLENNSKSQALAVQFLPEGGDLVIGLTSKIAFQVTDKLGNGTKCRGAILTTGNDTIVTFRPLKFGIGHFYFTPKAKEVYHAVITDANGAKSSFSLPVPKEKGFVMLLEEIGNQLEVKVTSQPETMDGSSIYLFAHTRNMVSKAERKFLQSKSVTFQLDRNKLADGVSHITIFDDNLRPVCERLYFKQPTQKLVTEIETDNNEYEPRQTIKLNLSVNNLSSNLSVAVYKTDSISPSFRNGIAEYLWLTSDLNGTVESPEYYLNDRDPDVKEAIDNLMLTHGWRRFKWDDVLKGKRSLSYLPEFRNHVIKGVVRDASGTPASRIMTYMASPSKAVRLYVSRSNAKGEIFYETRNFYDLNKIIIQTNNMIDSTYHVELEDPFSHQFSSFTFPAMQLVTPMRKQLLSRSIDMQVQDIYKEKNAFDPPNPVPDSVTFYDKADEIYYLDQYTRFPVMEEVFREYIHGVMVRNHKERFHLLVLDNIHKSLFDEDPLVMIDGVPIFNSNKFMSFSPLKIRKIEVFDRKYFIGPSSFPGVISCTTYKGDLGGYELDGKKLSMDYEGLQQQREFYSPRYQNQYQRESRLPDNRSLLYWNPSMKADKSIQQIEFFSSDLSGKYQVVVEGISKEGIPGSSVYTFEVKKGK